MEVEVGVMQLQVKEFKQSSLEAGFASRVLERRGPTMLGFLNVLPAQLLDKISIHLLRKSYKIHRESILCSKLPSLFFLAVLFASQQSKHTCFHEQHQPWPLHASHSLSISAPKSYFLSIHRSEGQHYSTANRKQALSGTEAGLPKISNKWLGVIKNISHDYLTTS